ncbi:MAG TPA: LegC family aminotransferase [Chryseosolibacter sp.]
MANTKMFNEVISFIRNDFNKPSEFIGLHEPLFVGNEKKYLCEAVDSTFVSSVGKFVDQFEESIRNYTGAKYAVATANGTSALHVALLLAGVKEGDLVITQPLSFIATCNAIKYCNAEPLFIDIDRETLSLSPEKLRSFLKKQTKSSNGILIHTPTGRRISACVPMHTFGFPAKIDALVAVCEEFRIPLVEDSAESLGTIYKNKHTGTFGLLGVYSFNGNKTITCGGGGVVVTDNENLAKLGKHLTTQAKKPHPWEFDHDHIGYNYRMPNINAALGCAQLEMLEKFIESKRALAERYRQFFINKDISFMTEGQNTRANYWLNVVLLKDRTARDKFLEETNAAKVMTRPVWKLMNKLEMFKNAPAEDLSDATFIEDRLVNIPSSPRLT